MKYLPLKDCPVCNSSSGKCRSTEDGNREFTLCMGLSDEKFGTIINGWKCIKSSDGKHSGDWSTWVIDNTTEWTEEKRREWELERARRQWEKARESEDRRRRSLSPEERDRGYRAILAQLTLHPDDLKDLERRGFATEEIEHSGFKSVSRNQPLTILVNPGLPGVSDDGSFLLVDDGYLCPVTDVDGRIVACQIRLRQPQDGNRYKWLSSRNHTLHLYLEPKSEGELPLAVFRPLEKPVGISFAEGTGAKPFLVSQRRNEICIGAAGGQWSASPTTCKRTLSQLAGKVKNRTITLYPDAGDILNRSVMKRWRRVVQLLRELKWDCQFAWWGQVTKEDCDIDELTSYDAIEYLTPDDFWQVAKLAKAEWERAEEERQARLKAEAEEQIYKSLTSITEPAWKVINEPEINLKDLIEPGAVYFVLSAKGTGKTKGVKPVVDSHRSSYAWFSRTALGREECHRLGLAWKDEQPTLGRGNKRGFCSDSSPKFNPKVLSENGLLLVDECDQVFAHNFGSTCNKDGKRPQILATLEAHLESAIAGGGTAIFLSADVSQKEIDYIKALAPIGCPVRLIVNEYKPPKGDLYFDESDKPDGLIESLLAQLENNEPCFVIDDIKDGVRGCKSIAEYIRTIHPEWAAEIVEINSDTSGDPETVDYVKNINEASKKTRLICCSPSVVSGISIENGRFIRGVYGLSNGVLTVSDMSQAISRVRGAETVNVWAAEKGLIFEANRAKDPREISDWYHRNYEANAKHILGYGTEYDPIKGEWLSPHWRLKCQNDAYRNLCMDSLRERLKARLEEEGYNVFSFSSTGSDMVANGLKGAWSKIEIEYAEAVGAANILTDAQLEALQYQSEPLTPEEKLDVEKTFLLKWFGEELINATTFTHKETGKVLTGYAAMYLKNERGEYRRKLENFYLLVSEASEAIAKDTAAEHKQAKHGHGRFPGDVSWKLRQKKAREWLGLPEFLDPDKWTTPMDYRELEAKAKGKVELVKDVLRYNPENVLASQIFTELLAQLGLELDKEWVPVPAGQKRYKRRRITAESWRFAQMYVTYRQSLKAAEATTTEPVTTVAVAEPVAAVATEPTYQQMEISEATPISDHPPLLLYTEPIFRGGVIRDFEQNYSESQRKVLEADSSGEAIAITLPSAVATPATEKPSEATLKPGADCWVRRWGEWKRCLLLEIESRPVEKFFKALVRLETGLESLVWVPEFLVPLTS